ncbi:transposase [Dysgonomonas sp. Marseille-P4677]|uniref:transposase n=1 Tax=Dysgonomonas sp. Marseille-P4677 TaxID=2364790 RepID=UPI001911D0BA|nr:transposase [Dysgonomonas sp. Marseille-P4677]
MRKRIYDLKEIFNIIFYLVKIGCQWRMLSKEYSKWGLAFTIFANNLFYENFDLLLSGLRE